MDRTQKLLVGALVVQVALIFLVRAPFSSTGETQAAQPLFPSLQAFVPARLEIEGNEDKKISLSRTDGGWKLEELGGFPADETKVDELLDDLRDLTVRRPVVSGSRYHGAFKVADDDYEGRVRIWEEGSDDPEVDLILGSSPNYRAIHVRAGDRTPVYEVRDLTPYDVRADLAAWADKDLVTVSETSVQSLSVENGQGRFELIREEGSWRVAAPESMRNAELNPEEVDSLVGSATTVRLAAPVGPIDDDSQHEAEATVTLRFQDGEGEAQEVVYRIGGVVEDQETQRYVTRDGFGFRGTVWESSIQQLIDAKIEDLFP